ncbi:MAG: hypothetical protein ABI699_09355 [Caldimonas sp.]
MPLHIVASLRIIALHQHTRSMTVERAQEVVKDLALVAGQAGELEGDRKLREDLERATKLPIAELAVLAERWG